MVSRRVSGHSYSVRIGPICRKGSASSWSSWSVAATVGMTQSAIVQGKSWQAGVWKVGHRAAGPFGDIEEGYVKVNMWRVSNDGFFRTVEVTGTVEPSQSRYPNQVLKFPGTIRGSAASTDEIASSSLRDGVSPFW
jgi:hypothetical protein